MLGDKKLQERKENIYNLLTKKYQTTHQIVKLAKLKKLIPKTDNMIKKILLEFEKDNKLEKLQLNNIFYWRLKKD